MLTPGTPNPLTRTGACAALHGTAVRKPLLVALTISALLAPASLRPATSLAAPKAPPASTGVCPRISYGIIYTCFAPTDLAKAQSYLHPAPIDPTATVTQITGFKLNSVLVVWCSARELSAKKCRYDRAETLFYSYGPGASTKATLSHSDVLVLCRIHN